MSDKTFPFSAFYHHLDFTVYTHTGALS